MISYFFYFMQARDTPEGALDAFDHHLSVPKPIGDLALVLMPFLTVNGARERCKTGNFW